MVEDLLFNERIKRLIFPRFLNTNVETFETAMKEYKAYLLISSVLEHLIPRRNISRVKFAISRTLSIAIVVVVIILIISGAYLSLSSKSTLTQSTTSQTSSSQSTGGTSLASSSSISSSSSSSSTSSNSITQSSTSSTTSSSTTQSSSTSSTQVPQSLTYETLSTIQYVDPQVSYDIYGAFIIQNVYEMLLWYNGANGSALVPWLAQNYSISPDGKTVNVNLRHGITFADGEQFNSTAVYFSYNRNLILDGSAPYAHATQASWIIQQLVNRSYSSAFSGPQNYSQSWASKVISQNLVQITGAYSLTLHIQNPNSALPYLLAETWGADIVAPDYVMQHDISLWSQQANGYSIPYPNPSGNDTTAVNQYLHDEVATCNAGVTLKGCGVTYLDGSYNGSLAGTGPYTIQSVGQSTNNIVLQSNPRYWGGPTGQVKPKIQTVHLNYVPTQTTRELDLQNAAKSGQALMIDLTGDHLYDVANRTAWLNNNQLQSTIDGVTTYGPYAQYAFFFDQFGTNVSSPLTGTFYKFQPFADLRLRLAFADAVNLTSINISVNNKLGQVAYSPIPLNFPPSGSYNASLRARYSYNLTATQNLLLDAMLHPLTNLRFFNGTVAPSGVFNNTFGCASLGSNGQCSHPAPQTVTLVYGTGYTVDQAILNQIAENVNNISATYNMGLTVAVEPLPAGQMISEGFSGQTYLWAESAFGWFDDYPWVMDALKTVLAPGGQYNTPAGWNLSQMVPYWDQAVNADLTHNIPSLVSAANSMVEIANQQVMDLWTFYPALFTVATSNIQGLYFNPGLYSSGGPEYLAALS